MHILSCLATGIRSFHEETSPPANMPLGRSHNDGLNDVPLGCKSILRANNYACTFRYILSRMAMQSDVVCNPM